MLASSITQKGQTTIPSQVRAALHLETGDRLGYKIKEDGTVKVFKIDPLDELYHQSLSQNLDEWSSQEDEEAYGDL
jgi:AbrB family looped-hinge helix DNA binding protein